MAQDDAKDLAQPGGDAELVGAPTLAAASALTSLGTVIGTPQ